MITDATTIKPQTKIAAEYNLHRKGLVVTIRFSVVKKKSHMIFQTHVVYSFWKVINFQRLFLIYKILFGNSNGTFSWYC
jgi:hypothetical protein